jgi:hypothetical protein
MERGKPERRTYSMPSVFPGMDPYIEGQEWEDFHHHFIEALHNALLPQVRPSYVVRVEKRIYVEHQVEGVFRSIRPDLAVVEEPSSNVPLRGAGAAREHTSLAPVMLTVPLPEEIREAYLVIRSRQSLEVVTVIEVLSPANKRSGSDGRREYLAKREAVLRSSVHLVELDLLRGGLRLPTNEALPEGDYYAFVCRAPKRPRVEVYAWALRHRLPSVPVPLSGSDPDAALDLGTIFASAYDRAGYDYSLDYSRPVEPPLSESEAAWACALLEK